MTRKNLKANSLWIGSLILAAGGFIACGPVQFSKMENTCPLGQLCVNGGPGGNQSAEQSFSINGATNKVDILFIDDNSASMDVEQQNLGSRFSTFVDSLISNNGVPLDWQIGITTTNVCSAPNTTYEGENVGGACPQKDASLPINAPAGFNWESQGAQGILLDLVGGTGKIITPSTINAAAVFKQTIQIPISQTGSGDERPIAAAHLAIRKRSAENTGFFRPNSALAIIILTDEDERSTGGSQGVLHDDDQPSHLIAEASAAFPDKSVVVHTINVRNPIPGTSDPDTDCLGRQQSQQPFGGGNYGTVVQSLAGLTGGRVVDVCLLDYSASLQGIAGQIVAQTRSVTLAYTPIPGTVSVRYRRPNDPSFKTGAEIGISETVVGKTVTFNPVPPVGTTVVVDYQYNTSTGQKASAKASLASPGMDFTTQPTSQPTSTSGIY